MPTLEMNDGDDDGLVVVVVLMGMVAVLEAEVAILAERMVITNQTIPAVVAVATTPAPTLPVKLVLTRVTGQ
jgi:uncharacterized membrane protein